MFNWAAQSDGKLFADRDAVLRHLPLQSPFGPQRHRIPYWRTEHTKGDLASSPSAPLHVHRLCHSAGFAHYH